MVYARSDEWTGARYWDAGVRIRTSGGAALSLVYDERFAHT